MQSEKATKISTLKSQYRSMFKDSASSSFEWIGATTRLERSGSEGRVDGSQALA